MFILINPCPFKIILQHCLQWSMDIWSFTFSMYFFLKKRFKIKINSYYIPRKNPIERNIFIIKILNETLMIREVKLDKK